jgi:DNA-binding CsgD family transcriptional regulator
MMAIGKLDGSMDAMTVYQQRKSASWVFINLGAATSTNYKRSQSIAGKLLRRTADKLDRSKLAGMISECEFVAEWLETGRMPGDYHGVSRNSSPWDPDWINVYESPNSYEIDRTENIGLTDQQRDKLQRAMSGLSKRELQCYMLHVVDGMSIGDIGLELHLGKSTVQTIIGRAIKKIETNKMSSLFPAE